MKISIITASYNSGKTIEDTLKSVLKQDYDNYEYLIIDGKSKDNTLDIVNKYKDKFEGKLKVISEKDTGLYNAMNKGINLASGDIIGFINSDDVLANTHVFSDIVKNIKGVDGVYSNLLMLDNKLEKPYRYLKYGNVKKKLAWHPPHPTLYLKKEVYAKYGSFDEKYRITADLDFMVRIINKDVKLKYIDKTFVFMRSGGVSTNGLKGYYNNFKESYKVLLKNKVKFPLTANILRIIGLFTEKNKAKKIDINALKK